MWALTIPDIGGLGFMIRKYGYVSSAVLLALTLVFQTGCPAANGVGGGNRNSNGNTNDNDNGSGNTNANVNANDNGGVGNENTNDNSGGGGGAVALTPVKTDIDVHNGARIAVGDDLLVYGWGGFAGVDYIIPSAGDTVGRNLPNGDTFVAGSFAVSGKKIALVNNFLITIFDTATETATEIGEDVIRLVNTPSGIYSQGHPVADGPYIACRNAPNTNGGSMVVVIDVTGDVPEIISFTVDPDDAVDHIAVDADAAKLAVAARDVFYIYDINDPTAAPTVFDTNPERLGGVGGISDNIFTFDGGYIFYEDNEPGGNAVFLNVADGTTTKLTENPASGEQCHSGGSFVYLLNRDSLDSNGNDARGGYGTVPGPGAALAGDEPIDGSTTNNGFHGWSQACSVTPDGTFAFLSGKGGIGSGEFLQVSTGGAFSLITDPDGSSDFGLPGTDVTTSATLVGFKTGQGTSSGSSTKVGYIILGN